MWVRFWYYQDSEDYSRYEYVSDRETDESLKEIADEYRPSWTHSRYGFEKLDRLPEPIRQKLLAKHYKNIECEAEMVRILSRPGGV